MSNPHDVTKDPQIVSNLKILTNFEKICEITPILIIF